MAKLGVHSTLEVVALTRPKLDALPEIRQLRGQMTSTETGASGSGSLPPTGSPYA
jgi:hypothetical protein